MPHGWGDEMKSASPQLDLARFYMADATDYCWTYPR